MTVDEFLVWAEGRPGRHELVDGRIQAMVPERVRHTKAKLSVVLALLSAVQSAGLTCDVLQDGATVRVDAMTAFEPDALVRCGPPLDDDAIETPDPLIVVEVLSPGSDTRDRRVKVSGYFRVPSIQHYLIVDTERRLIVHYRRTEGGVVSEAVGFGILRLDPPGLNVDVAALLR